MKDARGRAPTASTGVVRSLANTRKDNTHDASSGVRSLAVLLSLSLNGATYLAVLFNVD